MGKPMRWVVALLLVVACGERGSGATSRPLTNAEPKEKSEKASGSSALSIEPRRDSVCEGGACRGEYPLDVVSRKLSSADSPGCPEVELERYTGTTIKLNRPVELEPALVPYLQKYEELVAELSKKHYGRAPDRMLQIGGYQCRQSTGSRRKLSEHALGNAVDIAGFRFLKEERFLVTLKEHWSPRTPQDKKHACFFRELASETIRRRVFRGVIGPGTARHDNHFHLDMGQWELRQVDFSGTAKLCGFDPEVTRH